MLLDLREEALEHHALAGPVSHEVPQVADLLLADAVDAAEALLNPVRVPRQVVVDHQVRPLQVHALTRGIGRDKDLHRRIVAERVLHPPTVLALHAAMDDHHCFLAAEQCSDLAFEVVERVTVLGEHDELAWLAGRVELVRLQDVAKLDPLLVLARRAEIRGEHLQHAQLGDLSFEFDDRLGAHRVLDCLVLEILELLGVEVVAVEPVRVRQSAAEALHLAEASSLLCLQQLRGQLLLPASQRLEDRLG